jgi:hypothetical protein
LIDPPGALACPLRHANSAAIQEVKRLFDRFADRAFGGRPHFFAAIEGRIDCFGELG